MSKTTHPGAQATETLPEKGGCCGGKGHGDSAGKSIPAAADRDGKEAAAGRDPHRQAEHGGGCCGGRHG